MNPILALSIGAFLVALILIAFSFYYIGKYKTVTINYLQIAGLFVLTLITALGDPASNYLQTIGAITFSYLATATISYILGYTDRSTSNTNVSK